MLNKIIIAADSFKGSLTSEEVALAVKEGIQSVCPDCEILHFPVADGGEGILEAFMTALKGSYISVQAHDPLMKLIDTRYGISDDKKTAFIEMAAISGLPLVPVEKRNPLFTTTYGTGELIKDAIYRGCRKFIIGIGGSATNDAGLGMLQALGFRFFKKDGQELGYGGEIMEKVASIDCSSVLPELQESHFTIACDVDNPFYGLHGAAYVFAPQKGADEAMVQQLDLGMRSLAQVIHQTTGNDIAKIPGAGAAGGLGGAFCAFFDADLVPGIYLLLEVLGFQEKIKDADLIITGEGKLDRQTLMGKVPYGVLKTAQKEQIPVIAIAGRVEDDQLLKENGFKGVYSIHSLQIPLEQAMQPDYSKQRIKQTVASILKQF